jgi:broad specificity phosphatase PhoE
VGRLLRLVIYFETHATSLDNEAGLASGQYDSPLSEAGKRQAQELGERYARTPLAAVFCSDLERSYSTAEIAFAGRDAPIFRNSLLRECDYGELSRHPVSVIDPLRLMHLTQAFPGGESYCEAVARAARFVDELPDAQAVLVTGHRATYYAFEHLLGRRALDEVISEPWSWQPGWRYEITKSV